MPVDNNNYVFGRPSLNRMFYTSPALFFKRFFLQSELPLYEISKISYSNKRLTAIGLVFFPVAVSGLVTSFHQFNAFVHAPEFVL